MFWDWGVVTDVGGGAAGDCRSGGLLSAVCCLAVWSWKELQKWVQSEPTVAWERVCVSGRGLHVSSYIHTSSDCLWSSSGSLCMLRHAVNDRGDPELYSSIVHLFPRWPGTIDNALKKTYCSARRCIWQCPVPRACWTLYLTVRVFCSSTRRALSFPVSPYTRLLQALSALKRTLAVRARFRKILLACI